MLGNYKFVKAIFQEEQESIEGIEILNRHKTAVEFKSVNFGYVITSYSIHYTKLYELRNEARKSFSDFDSTSHWSGT